MMKQMKRASLSLLSPLLLAGCVKPFQVTGVDASQAVDPVEDAIMHKQAFVGAVYEVPTLDGGKAQIKIDSLFMSVNEVCANSSVTLPAPDKHGPYKLDKICVPRGNLLSPIRSMSDVPALK